MNDKKPAGFWAGAKPWVNAVLTANKPQPCTDAQLDAVAAHYATFMQGRGFVIGAPERDAIRRMAAIQDGWRCAFAKVLGS